MFHDVELGERFTFTYQGPKIVKPYTGRLIQHSTSMQKSERTGNVAEPFIRIETRWSAKVCDSCGAQSRKYRKGPNKGKRYCPNCSCKTFRKASIWRPISFCCRFILDYRKV